MKLKPVFLLSNNLLRCGWVNNKFLLLYSLLNDKLWYSVFSIMRLQFAYWDFLTTNIFSYFFSLSLFNLFFQFPSLRRRSSTPFPVKNKNFLSTPTNRRRSFPPAIITITVKSKMPSRQFVIMLCRHRHMHHRWSDNDSSYHNRLLVIARRQIPSAMIRQPTSMLQFWNS